MNEFKKFSGILGIIILLLSVMLSMALPQQAKYFWIGYGLGLAMLAFFIITNFTSIREGFTGRSAKYGSYMLFHIVLVLFILGFINAITLKHSKQWDVTENKRFTLADQTVKVLKNLQEDVNATCYFTDAAPDRGQAENLLNMYQHQTSKFKFQFIDPRKQPALAEQDQIVKDSTLVLKFGDKKERIVPPDSTSEEAITNALIKITRSGTKTVYFVKGHGEKDINVTDESGFSFAKEAIAGINYEVKELLLAQKESVPEDCSILIIAGPQTDYFDEELELITKYIDRPGNALFMIDPGNLPGLTGFFDKYGLTMSDNKVVDKLSRIMGGDYLMPLVSNYSEHPVAKNMGNFMTFFPLTRGLEIKENLPDRIKIDKICETSPQSWGETDLDMLEQGQARFDTDQDMAGPVTIAVAITVEPYKQMSEDMDDTEKPKQAHIIVFGDANFADNRNFGVQKNGDLFMNSISFLAEEKDLIAIRPKSTNNEPIVLTKSQYDLVWYFSIIVLPFFVGGIGVAIFTSRRRRG